MRAASGANQHEGWVSLGQRPPPNLSRLLSCLLAFGVLAVGGEHLYLWHLYFHRVHVIGALFVLDFAVSLPIAAGVVALEAPVERRPGCRVRRGDGRRVPMELVVRPLRLPRDPAGALASVRRRHGIRHGPHSRTGTGRVATEQASL